MTLLPVLLAVLVFPPAPAPGEHEGGAEASELGAHLEAHPAAAAPDLYKFLHQAVFGPGHAIPNRGAAARYLVSELEGLGPPLPGEARCERLGGEPGLVRVNLRPFLVGNGDTAGLVEAFVATANEVHGAQSKMVSALAQAASVVRSAGRGALAAELETLGNELASANFPAVHHSEAYREAYRPAYRVIAAERAKRAGWCSVATRSFEF